ncbi:MAG: nucleotide exchange factor GrpE [Candidatus Micrarchaeales archaeon]|jgi:molecular chaperone GrpE
MADERKETDESKKNGEKQDETKKQQKPEALKEENAAEIKDRLLRLAAEFDNYKKKTAKDIDSAKNIGKAELIKNLLPAIDEFELALYALTNSAKESCNVKGVELVFSNVIGTLKNSGLKEIEAKGKYDPYKHEIILTRDSKEEEGTIVEIVRKGYTFNDLLLRPTAVIVSKGKEMLNGNGKTK